MTTRGVIGDVHFLDNSAAEGDPVLFRLERVGFAEDAIYMPSDVATVVQADGTIERRELWASAEGGRNLLCIMPNGYTWKFSLEPGATDITLQELHALNAPLEPEVSPTIRDLTEGLITAERVRYADTADTGLGAALIGYSGRTVQERLTDRRSILDLIPTSAERIAIQAGTSTTDTSDYWNIMLNSQTPYEVPAGDYIINTTYGSGRDAYSLLGLYDNVNIKMDSLARLLIRDGAHGRPWILRGIETFKLQGGQVIDQRTVKAGAGLNIENSSHGHVSWMRIKNFGSYGLAVTEDTSAFLITAQTISFEAATHRIKDTANGLGPIVADNVVVATGTVSNNGTYHVISTSGDGGWVEVSETLVDETPGATVVEIVSDLISVSDSTLYDPSGGFLIFEEGNLIDIEGFVHSGNNGNWTIDDITSDGLYLTVRESGMVSESAGATITIGRVGRSTVRVIRATACNDIVFEHTYVSGIGRVGYEIFPKAISYGLTLFNTTAYNCGKAVPGGSGYKVGQNYTDCAVIGNTSAHNNIGFSFGNWIQAHYANNLALNSDRYAFAATCSHHSIVPLATFESLTTNGNIAAYTRDFGPGVDGEPVQTDDLFVPPTAGYTALNLNGLYSTPGLIDLSGFVVRNWSGGWGLTTSRVRFPNLHIRNNVFDNCGSSGMALLTFTGTVVSGSPVISGLTNLDTLRTGTSGWYKDSDLLGQYIPDDAKVLEVNAAAGTLIMDTNATGSGLVTFYSGVPDDLDHSNNTYINSALDRNVRVFIQGRRAKSLRNRYTGYGQYNLLMQGDGSSSRDEVFIEPNPLGTADAGLVRFLVDFAGLDTGVYEARDLYCDLGQYQAEGADRIDFMVNYNGTAGIRAVNLIPSNPDIRPFYAVSSPVLPTLLGTVGANRIWSATTPPASGNAVGDICWNPAGTAISNIAFWKALSGTVWRAYGDGRGTTAQRPTGLGTAGTGFGYWDTTISKKIWWNGSGWDVPV